MVTRLWTQFPRALLLSELILCSLWFPSLADLLGVCLSRNHSTDNVLVLGLQRLPLYNVSAPVLTEMFLSFPFPAPVECLGQPMSYPGREAEKELVFHCSVYWIKRLFLPYNTDELDKPVLYCLFTSCLPNVLQAIMHLSMQTQN